mgnify:CR=1 FL=1
MAQTESSVDDASERGERPAASQRSISVLSVDAIVCRTRAAVLKENIEVSEVDTRTEKTNPAQITSESNGRKDTNKR